MPAGPSVDPARSLHEHLITASPDPLRELLGVFIDTLMGVETDAICGAEYGTRSAERTKVRNGYRHRDFDTRVGTIDVAAALTSVVATCYLLGVSTRRMDKLVDSLGITRLSKSQVSHGGRPGRAGRGVPDPTVGCQPLHVRCRRRPDGEGP